MDHHPGKGLAYVWGRRQATVFVELKALWEPFGITRYCTEGWGAYEWHGEAERPTGGKAHTQKIESHYFSARLPEQFDAILHCDETRAVEPMERTAAWERGEVPETFPTGL
jgi:hypothetical protein